MTDICAVCGNKLIVNEMIRCKDCGKTVCTGCFHDQGGFGMWLDNNWVCILCTTCVEKRKLGKVEKLFRFLKNEN